MLLKMVGLLKANFLKTVLKLKSLSSLPWLMRPELTEEASFVAEGETSEPTAERAYDHINFLDSFLKTCEQQTLNFLNSMTSLPSHKEYDC